MEFDTDGKVAFVAAVKASYHWGSALMTKELLVTVRTECDLKLVRA
jgi:hypothetical protein